LALDNDWGLLQRATCGDGAAWTALSAKYRPRLLGLAYTITGSRVSAEDIAQESFARLFTKPPRSTGESLMPYLSTIAYRLAFKESKRLGRLVDLKDSEVEDAASTPDEELLNRERRTAVRRAVGTLSTVHREVIALRFQGGLSYEEIAALLNIPLGTVRSRLFNAVVNCRKMLVNKGLINDTSE
jgi:RNA polymerase sigma-70 factor, ECF subfamily